MLMKFDFDKLKEEWELLNIGQTEAAQIMGMTQQALNMKCNGHRTQELTASQVANMCHVINRPIDMFIKRVKEN